MGTAADGGEATPVDIEPEPQQGRGRVRAREDEEGASGASSGKTTVSRASAGATVSKPNPRERYKLLVQSYYNQMTKGCCTPGCRNLLCRSNPESGVSDSCEPLAPSQGIRARACQRLERCEQRIGGVFRRLTPACRIAAAASSLSNTDIATLSMMLAQQDSLYRAPTPRAPGRVRPTSSSPCVPADAPPGAGRIVGSGGRRRACERARAFRRPSVRHVDPAGHTRRAAPSTVPHG